MSISVAIQDHTSRIYLRHVDPDTREEIAVASGTVSIYRGNNKLVDAASVTVSGSRVYYEATWSESTWPLDSYRAEWSLVDTSAPPVTRVVESFFEVVVRHFRCPVGASDFSSRYPYLTQLFPSGTTLADFLDSAWEEIELTLYGKLERYPGNVFHPEQFAKAAEYWCVADAYRAISRGSGTEDEQKANHYRERAMQALTSAQAFVRADTNDDNVADASEVSTLSSIRVVR